jgi:hypothetical protein
VDTYTEGNQRVDENHPAQTSTGDRPSAP